MITAHAGPAAAPGTAPIDHRTLARAAGMLLATPFAAHRGNDRSAVREAARSLITSFLFSGGRGHDFALALTLGPSGRPVVTPYSGRLAGPPFELPGGLVIAGEQLPVTVGISATSGLYLGAGEQPAEWMGNLPNIVSTFERAMAGELASAPMDDRPAVTPPSRQFMQPAPHHATQRRTVVEDTIGLLFRD